MRIRLAIQTALFISVFYVALPAGFVALNERLGWPRWESDLGDLLGTLLIVCGVGTFLYCSDLFRRLGRGTPAPNQPPMLGRATRERGPSPRARETVMRGVRPAREA